ncbi:MAG: GNAT family N-acetyltransferase [Clostridia bacterium]|nr:GNAT family N-acetyltransferase [Clostridia bacterium]
MNDREILEIALKQSAWDMSCDAGDFLKEEPVVVLSKSDKRKKKFMADVNVFEIQSYGTNVVASVCPELEESARAFLSGKDPERAFEPKAIIEINRILNRHGYEVAFMGLNFLPRMELMRAIECPYETRLLEKGEFEHLYTPSFSNALCEERKHLDILCAAAYEGGREIGLAGCSMDGEEMWQIGIDVLAEYRKQGVASALTSKLALEVLRRGRVPFYGCAWANVKSHRNAAKCGFRAAWATMTAKKIKPEREETK